MTGHAMTADAATNTPPSNALKAAFDQIIQWRVEQKEIGEQITDFTEETCLALSIAPKAFKVALKWYGMTEGERADFETALQLAQNALRDPDQGDLFDQQLKEKLAGAVVSIETKRNRRRAPLPTEH
jgi:hypothetical protein